MINPATFFRFLLLAFLLGGVINASAQAESASESAVKTAFLFNFFKFIDWPKPAANQTAYTLCTTDNDQLGDSLLVLAGKSIGHKALLVRRGVDGKDLKNCHLVFINASENAVAIMQALKGLPVVTVSDQPGFINQGGMIGLVENDNRLSFEVNLDALNVTGLHISVRLLKLAKRVITEK